MGGVWWGMGCRFDAAEACMTCLRGGKTFPSAIRIMPEGRAQMQEAFIRRVVRRDSSAARARSNTRELPHRLLAFWSDDVRRARRSIPSAPESQEAHLPCPGRHRGHLGLTAFASPLVESCHPFTV